MSVMSSFNSIFCAEIFLYLFGVSALLPSAYFRLIFFQLLLVFFLRIDKVLQYVLKILKYVLNIGYRFFTFCFEN